MDEYATGTLAGAGSFTCQDCGFGVALMALDTVPTCPNCGSEQFRRASMFASPMPDVTEANGKPDWLDDLHGSIEEAGHYLAFMDDDRISVIQLHKEWTRIGRSIAADVRLDDPTVSRRHALVVRQARGVRILDDRSLNGIFVNGERVEWQPLSDGDELMIGRFCIYFVDVLAADVATAANSGTALA